LGVAGRTTPLAAAALERAKYSIGGV